MTIKIIIPIKCTTLHILSELILRMIHICLGSVIAGVGGALIGGAISIIIEALIINNSMNPTDPIIDHPLVCAGVIVGFVFGVLVFLILEELIEITCIKDKTP